MCGIWVSVGFPAPQAALDAVRQRGPDGEGRVEFSTPAGPVGFGHRRLAIYDLSDDAAQPMSWGEDGRYCCVFNGSIYNFLALRRELGAEGLRFTTESDTETLIAAYARWGSSCLARLNGQFAFAIFDRARNTLFLARDRFGEKPLHLAQWRQDGRTVLALASDIRQLLAVRPQLASLNAEVAANFINSGATDWDDRTFFAAVSRFPAAHWALLDCTQTDIASRPLAPQRWWSPPRPDPALGNPDVAAEALRPLLRASVDLRMKADVPVGSCLSGGLDSSGVVLLAARAGAHISTVSAIFDETTPDGIDISERPYVEAVARAADVTVHRIQPSDRDAADSLDTVIAQQSEPFASGSILVQHLVFRKAREVSLTVMLDGQGADELFLGYPGVAGAYLADLTLSGRLGAARRELEELATGNDELTGRGLLRGTYSAALPEHARRALGRLRGSFPPRPWLTPDHPPPVPPRSRPATPRADALVRDMSCALSLPALLRYEDRNAMAHGIEARLPYLDAAVSDLAFRTPASAKIAGGQFKRCLRLAYAGLVPDSILNRRRKLGFNAPDQRWLDGVLRPALDEAFGHLRRDWAGFVDPQALAWAETRRDGDARARETAFRLLCFSRWARAFGLN